MTTPSASLVDAIRSACPAGVWSQGAKLARLGIVDGIKAGEEELEFQIHVPGQAVAWTVVLYPLDEDWECDCPGAGDHCAHVAAAAIAWNQAQKEGTGLPRSTVERTKLIYRFERRKEGLALSRVFVPPGGQEETVRRPLMEGVTQHRLVHGYQPTPVELEVDRLIGRSVRFDRPLAPEIIPRMFAALADRDDLFLDGQPIRLAAQPLFPRVTLCDHGTDGVALVIEAAPDIDEVVAPGVAITGGLLCSIGRPDLCGSGLERLPRTAMYERSKLAELVARIVPSLEADCPIDVKTTRLPRVDRALTPRLTLEMTQEGIFLTVLPLLVYGDPPCVRIDNDAMVFLRGAIPQRDRAIEQRLVHRLRDELNLAVGRRVEYRGKEAAAFIECARQFDAQTGGRAVGDAVADQLLAPQLSLVDDQLIVRFVLEQSGEPDQEDATAGREAGAQSVLSAWQEGLGVVPLDGGGFARVPLEWLERHGHLVADLLDVSREEGRVPRCALPLLQTLADELSLPFQVDRSRFAPLLEDFKSIPRAPLPADLTLPLRPYQQTAVNWLVFLRQLELGAVLADDMGLGKTVEALGALEGRSLVVCPTSVLHNWVSEIARFRPSLEVCLYHGASRQLDPDADVVLTSYALLRIDAEQLQRRQWDVVVLDEAQNIKNPASQVARAAHGLTGKVHLALTGTPVENRLDELWSIFHFCNRGLLGSLTRFQRRFAEPIGRGDRDAANALRQRIRPFVLRRLKQEVAPELPPRTEQVLYCELDEQERQMYDAVRAATNKEVVAQLKAGKGVLAALESLLRLRQAACHQGLLPGQTAPSSSKVDRLLNRLDLTVGGGHKALVFSQWTSFLDRIEPLLAQAELPFCRLDGATVNRQRVVEQFQDSAGPPVMLISLKAGGTGLNLTQADHVFLMDPWWNPAVEDQAADRTHRIGQDKPVMVYRLVARGTVEERILELQQHKRQLADQALLGADQALALTKDDLLSLLT